MARSVRSFALSRKLIAVLALLAPVSVGCSSDAAPKQPLGVLDPGAEVHASLNPAEQAELATLTAEIASAQSMTASDFAAKYATTFASPTLPYAPKSATGFDAVQKSGFALNDAEQAVLASRGFVISERTRFPTFVDAYKTIYAADLPVYVSVDSILHAVHRSYDHMLSNLEETVLTSALGDMVAAMREGLKTAPASQIDAQTRADLDVYLAVARALLAGDDVTTIDAANQATAEGLVKLARAHAGTATITMFGTARDEDFSQFEPRGHYTRSEALGRYFMATQWLARVNLRILETQGDGKVLFRRRQLEDAVALRSLMDARARAGWTKIDTAVTAFVGDPDEMTFAGLDALMKDLGVADLAGLATKGDQAITDAIVAGGYGAQKIASRLIVNGTAGTLPLDRSFAVLPQRYTLDSHTFSNVVYDRVNHAGAPLRMMPSPLDAAFVALKNDQAGGMLAGELTKYQYAPELHVMRLLGEAQGSDWWTKNLYNHWLSTLRTLSPAKSVATPLASGMPSVTGTEAWGRRLLNAQLASWAELRHDTILYVKPSYTTGASCTYPDAYVDPYPEFYDALVAFAHRGSTMVDALSLDVAAQQRYANWFTSLATVAGTLGDMARDQRAGNPLTPAHLAFINRAVSVTPICGGALVEGWYADLFFDRSQAAEFDPTIADVHTQPTDEVGNPVGKVLHVGTGMARTMVVTVDGCGGAKTYVGSVSSYFEKTTENFERLRDEPWSKSLLAATPADVTWMSDLVVR
jgi:hypothetical protein